MIVTCPSCASRFQYEESRFKDLKSKRFRCPKCSHMFEVANPTRPIDLSSLLDPGSTSQHRLGSVPAADYVPPPAPPTGSSPYPEGFQAPAPAADHTGDTTAKRNRAALLGEAGVGEAGLPPGYRFTLAFLSGPHASTVLAVNQSRLLIGREEGDIVTMDPESSRRHAMIEILRDGTVWITDLNSTNGVIVDGEPIHGRAQLLDRTEFMCGRSTFMMMIRQDDPYGLG